MRHNKILCILFLLFLMVGCNSSNYKDFIEFDDHQWPKSKIIHFEYTPSENLNAQDILLTLRYNTAITHDSFGFGIEAITPSGETISEQLLIPRKNDSGELLGEEMGGYGDIEKAFITNFNFKAGNTYKFQIKHQMPPDTWGGVLGVGVIMRDTE